MGKRRLFLAVGLDNETRDLLAACLADQLEIPGAWKAAPPPNWHLTLRFLGWATEMQRDLVLMHLAEQLDARPFVVKLDGLGAFPKPRRATVLWMGVRDDEALLPLAAAAESAAVAAGFVPEDRPYHPHLTLARIRPPADVTELVANFAECQIELAVGAITLFESLVEPGGARYEAVDYLDLHAAR